MLVGGGHGGEGPAHSAAERPGRVELRGRPTCGGGVHVRASLCTHQVDGHLAEVLIRQRGTKGC